MKRLRLVAAAAATILAFGVGPLATTALADTTSTGPCGTATTPAPSQLKVAVVMLENESPYRVFGNPAAPYLNSLKAACGSYANYYPVAGSTGTLHKVPLTSGVTGGVPGQLPHLTVPSIFGALGTGRWAVQAEDMPTNCDPTSSGLYAAWHNVGLGQFYADAAADCPTQDTPSLATNQLADFTWVAPNMIHSGHPMSQAPNNTQAGRLHSADVWLSSEIPNLVDSPDYQAGNLVIFVVWDQPNGGPRIPCLVVSPYTQPGSVATGRFDAYSLLATIAGYLGVAAPGNAATASTAMSALVR